MVVATTCLRAGSTAGVIVDHPLLETIGRANAVVSRYLALGDAAVAKLPAGDQSGQATAAREKVFFYQWAMVELVEKRLEPSLQLGGEALDQPAARALAQVPTVSDTSHRLCIADILHADTLWSGTAQFVEYYRYELVGRGYGEWQKVSTNNWQNHTSVVDIAAPSRHNDVIDITIHLDGVTLRRMHAVVCRCGMNRALSNWFVGWRTGVRSQSVVALLRTLCINGNVHPIACLLKHSKLCCSQELAGTAVGGGGGR